MDVLFFMINFCEAGFPLNTKGLLTQWFSSSILWAAAAASFA